MNIKKHTKRKYFSVMCKHGHVWGTGTKKSTALKDAKFWASRMLVLEYIKFQPVKEITKEFYTFINDNSGNKADLKNFKGKKFKNQ